MVTLDEGSDRAVNQWVQVYVVVPLLASGAAMGLAWIDPTQLSLGPVRYVGLAGIGAGLELVAWTVLAYSRVGETLSPVVGPERLVTSGPLAWTRNPMYLGVLTTVAGVAVVAASPVVAGYTGLLGLVYHALVILVEEPKLESTFGDVYRDYCDRVPRWLPRRPE